MAALCAVARAAPPDGAASEATCASRDLTAFVGSNGGTITVRYFSGPAPALVYEAGLAIDADGAPGAYREDDGGLDYLANACPAIGACWGILQDARGRVRQAPPQQAYYVTPTSLRDPSRPRTDQTSYVDAETTAYIALPLRTLLRAAREKRIRDFALKLGDLAFARNRRNGKTAFALFADVGPQKKIGEGSMALARALGIPESPRQGGAADGVEVVVFLGSGNARPRPQREIDRQGQARLAVWGGERRLDSCSPR